MGLGLRACVSGECEYNRSAKKDSNTPSCGGRRILLLLYSLHQTYVLHLLILSYFWYIRNGLLICLSVARNRGSDYFEAADHATGEAYDTTFVAGSFGPLTKQLEATGII